MAKTSLSEQLKMETDAGQYVVRLLAALLNGEPSPPLPPELTWEQVYEIACMHSVDSMTFYAAAGFLREQAPEVYAAWEKRRQFNLIQSMTQLSERDRIIKALTAAGIRVLPVKGCMMKEVYPQIDWRQMCDLDMLIDEENVEKARAIMEKLGYTHGEDSQKDASYQLPPYMNVELHHKLFESWHAHSAEYYSDIWARAVPDAKRPGCFWLTPEDEYIYQMAHFNKHFTEEYGSGIRSILDLEVYRRHFAGQLNDDYLQNELRTLELTELTRRSESLAEHWFGTPEQRLQPLTEQETKMAEVVLCSGTYGTVESRALNQSQAGNQKRLRSWIFLPVYRMKEGYPILEKHPYLYPFCWLHRLFAKRQTAFSAFKMILWGK